MRNNGAFVIIVLILLVGGLGAVLFTTVFADDAPDGANEKQTADRTSVAATSTAQPPKPGPAPRDVPAQPTPPAPVAEAAPAPAPIDAVVEHVLPPADETKPAESREAKPAEPDPAAPPSDTSTAFDMEGAEVESFFATISGRVTNLAGDGIAGAVVVPRLPELLTSGGGPRNLRIEGLGGLGIRNRLGTAARELFPDAPYQVKGSTTSDASGHYVISIEGKAKKGFEKAAFSLRASVAGYEPGMSEELSVRAGGTVTDIKIEVWKPGSVAGIVHVKGTTDPYVGAKVRATMRPEGGGVGAGLEVDTEAFGGGRPGATTTDAEGKFRIDGLRPGRYDIVAEAETTTSGSATAFMVVAGEGGGGRRTAQTHRARSVVKEGEVTTGVVLELEKPDELLFRLAPPAAGKANVKLEGGNALGAGTFTFGNQGGEVEPDAEGVYRVTGVKSTDRKLTITVAGFAPTTFPIMPKSGEMLDMGVLTLEVGTTIKGRVVDRSGSGLAGIQVSASKASAGGFRIRMGDDEREVVTDATGRFEFPNCETGSFDIETQPNGFALARSTVNVVKDQTPEFVNLVVGKGSTVRGHVTAPLNAAAPSETPSSGIRRSISIGPGGATSSSGSDQQKFVAFAATESSSASFGGRNWLWTAQSSEFRADIDAEGNYLVNHIPVGSYHAIAVWGEQTSVKQNIALHEDGDLTLNFRFDVNGSVQGTVKGTDGNPAVGLSLTFSTEWWNRAPTAKQAVTDNAGRYRVDGLGLGVYYILLEGESRIANQTAALARRFEITETAPSATKDLELGDSNPTVKGRVTLDGAGNFRNVRLQRTGTPLSAGGSLSSVIAADGSFTIRDVAPGTYTAWFRDGEWQVESLVGVASVVVPNDPAQTEVELNASFRVGSLTGKVSGPSEPLPNGGFITIEPIGAGGVSERGLALSTPIDTNGEFAFPRLIEGQYRVAVTVPGFARESTDVEVRSATTTTLRVGTPACTVEIVVERTDTPSSNSNNFNNFARISAVDEAGRPVNMSGDPTFLFGGWTNGTNVVLQSLPPGRHTVTLYGAGIEPVRVAVEARSGQSTKYTVKVVTGSSIVIGVTNTQAEVSDDAMLAATVSLTDSRGAVVPIGGIGASAEFHNGGRSRTISGLAAGSYTLKLSVPGFHPFETTVTVAQSQSVAPSITLAKQ